MVNEKWQLSRARVLKNEWVSADVKRLTLLSPEIARAAQPGQFVNVKVNSTYAPLLRRPFSLNRIDEKQGAFSLLYKVVGEGTSLMSQAGDDDVLDVLGPLGNSFEVAQDCKDSIIIAGGIGIAPFYPLARKLLQQGQSVTCVMGARCREDINELDELRALGVNVLCATEDGSEGMRGLVTDVLRAHLKSNPCSMAYACGPNAMLAAVKAVCAEFDTPLQLSLEAHMACGLGVCLGCTCRKGKEEGYVHVCKEGPIFWAEEVAL